MSTNITDMYRGMFKALTSGEYRNFALFSCFVNGEPAVAIVAVNRGACPGHCSGDEEYVVAPLFVSITDQMILTDHDGNKPEQ